MNRRSFKRVPDFTKPLMGQWVFVKRDGKLTPKFCCPLCGFTGYLDKHEINADGLVEPSLICGNIDCTFHAMVNLLDYQPQEEPKMTNSEHMKNKDALDALISELEVGATTKSPAMDVYDGIHDAITEEPSASLGRDIYEAFIGRIQCELKTIRAALSPETQGGEGLDADIIHRAKVTLEYADVELHSLDHESIYVSDHAGGMTYADLRKMIEALQNNAQVDVDIEALKQMALTEFMKGRSSKELRDIAFEIISESFNILKWKGHLRAIPEGYALVPIEPTEEMIDAMGSAKMSYDYRQELKNEYKAAIAAAPQPKGE